MESLPHWALWIIAAAVGLSPGLAFLMVGPISRYLRRTLWPRSKGAPQLGPEQVRDELAIAAPPI
jgi:hypothetical protein